MVLPYSLGTERSPGPGCPLLSLKLGKLLSRGFFFFNHIFYALSLLSFLI